MAAPIRRESLAVIDRLVAEPHRFEFFQAVRLLARRIGMGQLPLADDVAVKQDVVRFRAVVSHCFPGTEIVRVEPRTDKAQQTDGLAPLDVFVSFLGLSGPSGVLPRHYTALLIERIREKDRSLADFLDLFNHRSISLFYRAWEKYRFPISFERQRLFGRPRDQEDLFTSCLYCLVGLGFDGLRNRQEVADDAVLYYGGLFAHANRNAVSLELLMADYFGFDLQVVQFQGQWLQLAEDDQTSLPSARHPRGLNCQLGTNVIAGERVWDVQSKFRHRIGPLSYTEFCRLMPSGDMLRPLCELTRTYVGPQFDYDVQPVLKAAEIPQCELGGGGPPPRLGWNTWARSVPLTRDADEVVFQRVDI